MALGFRKSPPAPQIQQAELALGTPEDVRGKVREELDVLAPGGGLILGPGCALPATTPVENIHTLVETVHHYGRYLPDGTLIS